ncbi:MAG TPA: hypothetical protein VHB54_13895, partial [Mucilaginibacter sp.]|nr:hypothetical protein [Mucilaginibacter sp.]
NKVLDTMPAKNKQLFVVETEKIKVLILLGEKEQSHKLVKKLYQYMNSHNMSSMANFYYKFYMNRTRADMINKRDIITFHHLEPK